MVRGLELFRDHFKGLDDAYVLIGGVASQLAMAEAGLDFRATKDLDIVLCVEVLDDRFIREFWEFINAAGYAQSESASGGNTYYRFQRPADNAYPAMLELFSRRPDRVILPEGMALTPIPTDSDVPSLSAILLDDTYYIWIMAGRRRIDGISAIGAEHLIPLKARAYLDLRDRKRRDDAVDSRDVRKHRNDVVRLEHAACTALTLQEPTGLAVTSA